MNGNYIDYETMIKELEIKFKKMIDGALFNKSAIATIISIQTGTVTIRFVGDDSDIAGVKYYPQYTPSVSDKVLVKIINNQHKSFNYVVEMKLA